MSIDNMHKVEVTATLHTEAAALAEVADILSLPEEATRQPDLQYLTAIFVSSGMNKNGAIFMGSELIKARGTIDSKAVDIEHEEQSIIGQITGNAFLKRDRSAIDAELASTLSTKEQDELEMDIGITAIIHKSRFPEISKQIEEGQWMVSMEAYYRDYDIKVGDKVIPKDKAEELGFDKLVGKVVQLKDGDKELGFHLVGRILRDILFAGVGIVRNPANPRSVIMEAAALNDYVVSESQKENKPTIDLADLDKVVASTDVVDTITVEFIKDTINEAIKSAVDDLHPKEEAIHKRYSPGTCVDFAKYVYTYPAVDMEDPATDLSQYPKFSQIGLHDAEGPGAEISKENYCKLFDQDCTSRPGDATTPQCLRNVFSRVVHEEVASHNSTERMRKIQQDVVSLQNLIASAKKIID